MLSITDCSQQMSIPTLHFMEPAYGVIEVLGGKTAVSQALGMTPSALSRWCQPKPKGTGGCIPQKHWPELLILGKKVGVKLKVEDLAGTPRR